jgi:hypothetical protein
VKCNGPLEPHEPRQQQLPLTGEYEGKLSGAINKYQQLNNPHSQHPMDFRRIKFYLETKTWNQTDKTCDAIINSNVTLQWYFLSLDGCVLGFDQCCLVGGYQLKESVLLEKIVIASLYNTGLPSSSWNI